MRASQSVCRVQPSVNSTRDLICVEFALLQKHTKPVSIGPKGNHQAHMNGHKHD